MRFLMMGMVNSPDCTVPNDRRHKLDLNGEIFYTLEEAEGDHRESALRPEGWVVHALGRLDGKRSVADSFQKAERVGELPQGFPLEAFADLVRRMIEHGLLDIEFPDC